MFRKFSKKQPRKPLSRQVNGLFEELEPRILYSASPLGLPPEALAAGEAMHMAPPVADHSDAETGAGHESDAAAGNGIGPAETGFEQIRATIDGIELWPLELDSESGELPATSDQPDVEASEAVDLLPAGEESTLLDVDEARRFWLQDDASILEAGLNTRESFSALLPETGEGEGPGVTLPDVEEPPVVNLEEGGESFSIYHEQGPREVLESVDLDLPEIQIAGDLVAIPLVQLTTLDR